jgi:hypothetical protein
MWMLMSVVQRIDRMDSKIRDDDCSREDASERAT